MKKSLIVNREGEKEAVLFIGDEEIKPVRDIISFNRNDSVAEIKYKIVSAYKTLLSAFKRRMQDDFSINIYFNMEG